MVEQDLLVNGSQGSYGGFVGSDLVALGMDFDFSPEVVFESVAPFVGTTCVPKRFLLGQVVFLMRF